MGSLEDKISIILAMSMWGRISACDSESCNDEKALGRLDESLLVVVTMPQPCSNVL